MVRLSSPYVRGVTVLRPVRHSRICREHNREALRCHAVCFDFRCRPERGRFVADAFSASRLFLRDEGPAVSSCSESPMQIPRTASRAPRKSGNGRSARDTFSRFPSSALRAGGMTASRNCARGFAPFEYAQGRPFESPLGRRDDSFTKIGIISPSICAGRSSATPLRRKFCVSFANMRHWRDVSPAGAARVSGIC